MVWFPIQIYVQFLHTGVECAYIQWETKSRGLTFVSIFICAWNKSKNLEDKKTGYCWLNVILSFLKNSFQ